MITDVTTKAQAAAGYRVTRSAVDVGHGAATGVYRSRIESTYTIEHHGRVVDTVASRAAIRDALLTYEGRVCLHEGDDCGGVTDDPSVVCSGYSTRHVRAAVG